MTTRTDFPAPGRRSEGSASIVGLTGPFELRPLSSVEAIREVVCEDQERDKLVGIIHFAYGIHPGMAIS